VVFGFRAECGHQENQATKKVAGKVPLCSQEVHFPMLCLANAELAVWSKEKKKKT
jgi:hypothetical protein